MLTVRNVHRYKLVHFQTNTHTGLNTVGVTLSWIKPLENSSADTRESLLRALHQPLYPSSMLAWATKNISELVRVEKKMVEKLK